MKKIIYSAMAVAMLATTSCKDDFAESFVGEEATVEFNISTPEIATRAFSEGDEIKHLHYAIYDGEDLLDNLGLSTEFEKAGDSSVNLSLTLKTGKTYKAIFWADAVDAPYDVVFTDGGATMTMKDQTIYSNDESLDAFYAVVDITITGNQQVPVYLKRPFAQINFGTNDIETAAAVGFDVDQTAMEVSVYTQMDLFNNSVVADSQTTKRFEYAAIPQGEQFPVDNYDYLAMNYVLVGEKQTADVTFYYTDTTGDEMSKHVGAVPMQRNYRTNIYGSVLTSTANVLVQVVPDFGGNENKQIVQVATLADLQAAIENESVGEIVLTNDIEVTETLVFGSKPSANPAPTRSEAATLRTYVLDLNGKTIKAPLESEGRHHYAIDNYATLVIEGEGAINARGIQNFGEMTINGNVTITNIDTNGGAAVWNEGRLTINNGTFTTNDQAGEGSYGAALNTRENGEAVVNGGTFEAYSQKTYAIINAGETVINNATVKGKHGAVAGEGTNAQTTINGGSFELMENPGVSDHCAYCVSDIKGGSFTLGNNTDSGAQVFCESTIADGYKAIAKDSKYYVVPAEAEAVATTTSELNDALANGDDVVLFSDIAVAKSDAGSNGYGATGISQLNGGVIDGNGNDLSVNAWGTWDSALNTTGGTIKNLNVTGGMRGIFVNHNSTNNSKVILENVVIDGTVYTISCDQGTNQGLEATNSTFNGWTSYATTIGNVKFTNCSFGEGQGYAFCRPYASTTFVGCNFAAGYEIDARATVTFENCTINGVALTEANLATLVTSNTANATVK